MPKPPLDAKLRKEFENLYASCRVNPQKSQTLKGIVGKILANRTRYETVSRSSRVPWEVIAAIHNMEASLRFDRHLHNGDPLDDRTKQVPKGRPEHGEPPFTWEVSATDALAYDKLTGWPDWTISGTLYKLEGYNGWGYRGHRIPSPYLWSFSQHYTSGKYVADGKWSATAVSAQCGAALILKELGYSGGGIGSPLIASPVPQPTSHDYPGFVVMIGQIESAHVLLVQKQLNRRGCGPVEEDGDFGPETADAVRAFQAQAMDSTGRALLVDGEVGAITWAALFGRSTVPSAGVRNTPSELLRKVVAVAKSQVGVSEKPPGSNAGPEVEAYLKSAGASKGDPWCMAFVFWCFKEAAKALGVPNPCVKTAGVHDHWYRADAAGARRIGGSTATANPAAVFPGMVFCIDTGGGKGHSGFVTAVNGGVIETVEGNTHTGRGREGISVMNHRRKLNSISFGFIDYSKF